MGKFLFQFVALFECAVTRHRGCDGTGGGDKSSWRCETQSKQITQPSAVALGSFTSYDRKSKWRVEITDSQLVTNLTQVENISSVFKC